METKFCTFLYPKKGGEGREINFENVAEIIFFYIRYIHRTFATFTIFDENHFA